jgi:prepilin-type N-terminal cleavage/methylation domain-containing protein
MTTPADRPPQRLRTRGFTLIEVMVVVVIIAVTAALAIPAATEQLRDRTTQRLAQDLVAAYRTGRADAMARGGAVLVRFDNGGIRVLQGIQGVSAVDVACAELPVAQCNRPDTNAWNNGDVGNRLVGQIDPASYAGSGLPMVVTATFAGQPRATIDVCFTPLGRAFARTSQAAGTPFAPMTGAVTMTVERRRTGAPRVGMLRSLIIPPSGAARLGASQ